MNTLTKALLFTTLAIAGTVIAENDFGPLKEAQEKYPHYFKLAAAGETKTPDGVEVYYYNGTAERLFADKTIESDADLWLEAEGDAKKKLQALFQEKDKTIRVTLSLKNARLAYRWTEGPYYRVLFVINKTDLKVTKTKLPPPVVAPAQPVVVPAQPVATPTPPPVQPQVQPKIVPNTPPQKEIQISPPPSPQPQKKEPIYVPLDRFNPNRIDPAKLSPATIDPSKFNPRRFKEPEGELSPFNPPKLVQP